MTIMTEEKLSSERNRSQSIMVIRNNLDLEELLNRSLELDGFNIIVAADENEAMSLLDKISPDMVIMDAVTADAHSLHILDSVREKTTVPVIMLISDNEMDSLKMVFEHGADDCIRKPFGKQLFLARIHAKLRPRKMVKLKPLQRQ